MNQLHDRINKVINTLAFEARLHERGRDLLEFQCSWHEYGSFDQLPEPYQDAILAGEAELAASGNIVLGESEPVPA
jgi:hypothetical protein